MTHERIRRAAEWVSACRDAEKEDQQHGHAKFGDHRALYAAADAAHILSLLADGKAVLCRAEPMLVRWEGGKLTHVPERYAPLDPWEAT